MFADLFPSGRGRPSVPAEVMASVIVLRTLQGQKGEQAARLHQMPHHQLGVQQLLLILSATLHEQIVPNPHSPRRLPRRDKSGVS